MYLFFDVETTGKPKKYNASYKDIDNWPRLVQLAFIVYDENKNPVWEVDHIIKPDNYLIPEDSSRIHGITTERALKEGIDLETALGDFIKALTMSTYLIAHNIKFDNTVIASELYRNNIKLKLEKPKTKICTMNESTNFCAIPSKWGFKWPKLSEVHIKLFGEDFEDAHNALADIRATARCFWELVNKGVIKIK
ncbi:MAG: exonuclease domain-containing protein [bacterium]